MLDQSYSKTETGRQEIKARALPLSRSARNLLLVLDASKPARQWLALVQGVSEADFAYLLEQGLVAPHGGASAALPAAAAPASAASAPAAPAAPSADAAQRYEQLYAYLTAQAPRHLGLMKGYMFALELEQCPDLTALQKLAHEVCERVRLAKGHEAEAQLREGMRDLLG